MHLVCKFPDDKSFAEAEAVLDLMYFEGPTPRIARCNVVVLPNNRIRMKTPLQANATVFPTNPSFAVEFHTLATLVKIFNLKPREYVIAAGNESELEYKPIAVLEQATTSLWQGATDW